MKCVHIVKKKKMVLESLNIKHSLGKISLFLRINIKQSNPNHLLTAGLFKFMSTVTAIHTSMLFRPGEFRGFLLLRVVGEIIVILATPSGRFCGVLPVKTLYLLVFVLPIFSKCASLQSTQVTRSLISTEYFREINEKF